MKILVAIASYGTNNDCYLERLISEYQSMPFQVDIVVVSNIPKSLPPNVEVIVGLPSKNPWSLPFAHKRVFVERRDSYDLFIYSEDDTLITQNHIRAFLQATEVLREDEIAGFLRSEQGPDGRIYYSTVHNHYHWDSASVCRRGNDVYAYFTNEHGACYILTQEQLRRSIASGGFCVPAHEGKYDMLVSAATDPYTQCGFKKLICISRLEDFTCRHLTNKYVGRTGLAKPLVDIQVRTLLDLAEKNEPLPAPIRVQPRLAGTRWIKSYYEPCRDDLLAMVPEGTQRVLSVGCGWGATEAALVNRGIHVTAVPLDVVIGKLAETQGVRVVSESLEAAAGRLTGERFDVLLISTLLHLVDDPIALLRAYGELLTDDGLVILSCPNMKRLSVWVRRIKGEALFKDIADYERSGIHQTSSSLIQKWLRIAGFSVTNMHCRFEGRWRTFHRLTLGLARQLWATEFLCKARKLA